MRRWLVLPNGSTLREERVKIKYNVTIVIKWSLVMLYSQALLDQQEKPYGKSLKLVLSVEVVSLNQFLKTFDGYRVI